MRPSEASRLEEAPQGAVVVGAGGDGGKPEIQLPFTPMVEQDREEELFYQTPTHPVSVLYRLCFSLAAIVMGVDNVTIKQLLLPAQIAQIAPTNKLVAFTLVASVGALAGVISSPLVGALSDRTAGRWGRRRPWIVVGVSGIVVGLVMMGAATSIWEVLLGEILVQFCADGLLAVCTAIIPDQIPHRQRYLVSALIGMAPLVGGGIGIVLISRLTNVLKHPDQGYYITAGISLLFVLSFLLILREKPLPRKLVKPLRFSNLLAELWVNPLEYPDFGFVWLSRCFAFFGYQVLVTYLLYYLQDVLHLQRADQGVATFQISSTSVLLLAAIGSGLLAGRLRRLKAFVICGALVMSAALFCIAFIASWIAFLLAGVFLGLGFGIYLAVDQAIAVRVLPRVEARGKDLGLMNTALFLPLIVGPVLGGIVLHTFHSYSLLFSLTAIFLVLAAVCIWPVKSVQ